MRRKEAIWERNAPLNTNHSFKLFPSSIGQKEILFLTQGPTIQQFLPHFLAASAWQEREEHSHSHQDLLSHAYVLSHAYMKISELADLPPSPEAEEMEEPQGRATQPSPCTGEAWGDLGSHL